MSDKENRLNNFVIRLANVNGTGSASANNLLMKSIFRMGIPVTGKNYFPSNIQGLPTWYEIRVSGDGYLARAGRTDIMVAMNAPRAAAGLTSVITDPSALGARNIVSAAREILDRSGVIKSEQIEVKGPENAVFILPPKQES